jgi:hypothetical protein
MGAEVAWRRKRAVRFLKSELDSDGRFVDFGMVVRVVEADPGGQSLIAGKPPLRVVATHRFGGIVDTKITPPQFIGPSVKPLVVTLSTRQWKLVEHGDDMPLRIMAYGSMGAGKTTMLVAWVTLRMIEFTGTHESVIGVTAPTARRMGQVKRMIGGSKMKGGGLWPRAWFKWSYEEEMLYCANGVGVEFRSTHQSSHAEGSPIQGQNWVASASDELQDSLGVESDIEARGRSAPDGRYKRFNTVTAKDSPDWRNFRSRCATSEYWGIYTLLGPDSPFVAQAYWTQLKANMTPRNYQRKVLCQDIASDDRVYTGWARELNMRPPPIPGAYRDVTIDQLRRLGGLVPYAYLIGHDPGLATDASVIFQCLIFPGEKDYKWVAVGEITSRNCTDREHAIKVLRWLQERSVCIKDSDGRIVGNGAVALTDPQTDPDTIKIWRSLGISMRPAIYKPNTNKPALIMKEARIDLVNTLVCDANDFRRLYEQTDSVGEPCAPMLVKSFEMLERNADGKAEHERKDENDLSHWTAAAGYGLYALERPRIKQHMFLVK